VSTIVQITDTHLLASPGALFAGLDTAASLAAVVAAARGRHPDLELVVASGDLVQDVEPAAYARFRDRVGRFERPVYCLPGNHDDPALMRRCLAGGACRLDAGARWGECLLLFLDSSVPGFQAGCLGPAALAWLGAQLDAAGRALVFVHHPPAPVGSAWMDRIGLADAGALAGVLAGRDRVVEAVICGHAHQQAEGWLAGVRWLATPSTCVQFAPGSERFALDERPPAYRWFRRGDDGSLATGVEWLPPDWQARA